MEVGDEQHQRRGQVWRLTVEMLRPWQGRNRELAFRRGFTARVMDDPGRHPLAVNPYTREPMRSAWFEGYRVAKAQEVAIG